MKKYIEIYDYYKSLIENNQIDYGTKMPSIRKATEIFNVSKTTIINAYFELQADGYIIASEKSGYYVNYQEKKNAINNIEHKTKSKVTYDFKSGDADIESFDIKLWQRYIKSALRQQDRLLSYGDEQGEEDLRIALAQYIREKRNVSTSPDRIVVGAGVQNLLGTLCTLIKDKGSVSFPDSSFYKGICLFEDYGFDVHTRYKDADIIYVCPSHMTSYGDVMPLKRRIELVEYSSKAGSIVIEDDYDNDFMYQTKPTPSLFALAKSNNVVYMGSFSNVLIPGIRISFMVLTEELSNEYQKNKKKFTQTASKTEQIALCQYIRDGHINSQTRKVRRLYTAKAKILFDEIKKQINPAELSISENSLQVIMKTSFNKDISIFEQNGISLNISKYEKGMITLVLSPSAVTEKDISQAVSVLKSIL